MRETFLPYFRPSIDESDTTAVASSMLNGWLTTGPKVKEFETRMAALSGVKHAVALNSCTAGLHIGMLALGVKPGDEIIMPSLTFVAGAESAKQIGAVPVFCDIDAETLCISEETIEKVRTTRTRVIMPMHYAGRPAGIRSIVAYASRHGIAVLEDAAHAVGMLDEGKWAGAVSEGAVLSFYATKNLATAEGGMFLTNDDALMERVRLLSLHGMDKDAWKRYTHGGTWRYDVSVVGYKYNMPDLCAALGLSQLEKLSAMQHRREEIAALYVNDLSGIPGVAPVGLTVGPRDKHALCMFPIVVNEDLTGVSRDQLIDELRDHNIGTSVHYIPTHLFSAFNGRSSGSLPVTERVWEQLISLPLYPQMTDKDVADVGDALRAIVSGYSTGFNSSRKLTVPFEHNFQTAK